MNEERAEAQTESLTHQRHAWRARFLTRFSRHKQQLIRRWWVPVTFIALGIALQSAAWRFEKPMYVSSGRMIVNLKLSIPEGSIYTEELNNFLGTQAALMQSAAVVQRVQQKLSDSFADPEIS